MTTKGILNKLENLLSLYDRVSLIEKNISSNNELLNTFINLEKRVNLLEENIKNNNELLKNFIDLERRVNQLEENTRNNNSRLNQITHEDTEWLVTKVNLLKREMDKLVEGSVAMPDNRRNNSIVSLDYQPGKDEENKRYKQIDYFDFENKFRGSRESIKERQRVYLPYFAEKEHVIDLGCGRGEFIELLVENGIGACGVDIYEEFVLYCTNRGLKAVLGDAIAYLEHIDKADGIFAGQLVEHLTVGEIIALCETAYEKLEGGSYLIMETPNPMSLSIYTNAFYIDPSHQKPVHPLTLQYLTKKAGFQNVEILFLEESRPMQKAPRIQGNQIKNEEEFNRDLSEMAKILYGCQDYAIIAQKQV